MLLTLACLAGIVSLTACTGSMEEAPKRLAQGILENETLGVTFRPGMTREEIEAQPIETFVTSSTMGEVTDGRYGMTQLDSIDVFYRDGITCHFWVDGEVDQDSIEDCTNDDEYQTHAKNSSHWTVDGLGLDATREDIKAWYGAPTWEARGNLGYHYRADGSFIDAETWQKLYEDEEAEGCSIVDDGTALSVTFYFWESGNMSAIAVGGSGDTEEAFDLESLSALHNDKSGETLRLDMSREEVEALVPQLGETERPGEYYGERLEDEVYIIFEDEAVSKMMVSAYSGAGFRTNWSLMGIRQGDSWEKAAAILGEEPTLEVQETDRPSFLFYCYSVTKRLQENPDSNTALVVTVRTKNDKVVAFGMERYDEERWSEYT